MLSVGFEPVIPPIEQPQPTS